MKVAPFLAIAIISTSLTACNGHLRGNPRHIRKELFLPGTRSQPSIAVATSDYQRQRRRLQEMASLEEATDASDDKTRLPPPEYFRPDIIGWGMMQPSKKEQAPGK